MNKATTVGAAALGGLAGVYFFGEVQDLIIWSLIGAYLSTVNNGVGDVTRKGGDIAAKVYNKAVDINEEYDVLPKSKNAVDAVLTAANNINKNYGLTASVDEKLGISEKAESLKG